MTGLDAMLALSERLRSLPVRASWAYVEPDTLEGILSECDPNRPAGSIGSSDEVPERIAASFVASVCGCLLGKPVEVQPSAAELRAAAVAAGEEWPPTDYISDEFLHALGRRHPDWASCVRGTIGFAPADDDINFRILAMLLLERFGEDFTKTDLLDLWTHSLPIDWVWASNRTLLLKAALHWWRPGDEPLPPAPIDVWVGVLNPYDEDCGAVIRVDPYGYAHAGRPEAAVALAWRDASATHTRTGVYAAMFQAAAVAAATVLRDPVEIVEVGLAFVPRRSRLYESLSGALAIVHDARDWEDAYLGLEKELGRFGHCQIHFELATVINTLSFAQDVGHGIGIQVAQGLDTDSFGASAGSLLGARFGPGHLADLWTAPLHDWLRTTVATFHEPSLSAVAQRMAALPGRLSQPSGVPSHASDGVVN